jgi:hypothetical protein
MSAHLHLKVDPQHYWQTIAAQFLKQGLPSSSRHYVVACFPKSGSTYLSAILANLIQGTQVGLVPGYGFREQELAPAYLALYHNLDYVAQHHLKCSAATMEMLSRFSIYPIVQIRNLFDVAVSLIDHLEIHPVTPVAFVADSYEHFDHETKTRFFAEMVAPWYINFFVSWTYSDCPATWVSYEDLIGNELETVRRICADTGLEVTDTEILAAVAAAGQSETRLNKGVTGRGQALPEELKDRILALTRFYPSIDFSPIGL